MMEYIAGICCSMVINANPECLDILQGHLNGGNIVKHFSKLSAFFFAFLASSCGDVPFPSYHNSSKKMSLGEL